MIKALTLGICKVSFTHQYEATVINNKKTFLTEVVKKPVSTTVVVEAPNERAVAKATCSPKDHFNFEKGRKKGLARCFEKMNTLTKEDRKRVWDEYNKLKTGGRW